MPEIFLTPPSGRGLQFQNQQLLARLNAFEALIIYMKTDISALKKGKFNINKKGEVTQKWPAFKGISRSI